MYNKILVPIDGSPTANGALAEAARVARLSNSTVRVLHICDLLGYVRGVQVPASVISELRAAAAKAAGEVLAEATAGVDASGFALDTKLIETAGERIAELIVNHAKEWGADLIVLGTHGRRGIERVMMGSDAEQVARTASVPVMLVRHEG